LVSGGHGGVCGGHRQSQIDGIDVGDGQGDHPVIATSRQRDRIRERLLDLAESEIDSLSLRFEAIEMLRVAIGFERWCWPTVDPGAALHLGGVGELDNWEAVGRCILLEQTEDPTNAVAALARAERHASSLMRVTVRDPARSARWSEGLQPWGIGDEMRCALVDDFGMWGFIDLLRDQADRPFAEADAQLLEEVGPYLARALRMRAARQSDEGPIAPPPGAGTLIFDRDLSLRRWTPSAWEWLDRLAPEDSPPVLALGVAARALAVHRGVALHSSSRVRARSSAGHWAIVEGTTMQGDEAEDIAVTVRPAALHELLDLHLASYDLSPREGRLASLVLEGHDTVALTLAMGISRYTVQDHLKSIFSKVGVQSRRELVARLAGGTGVALREERHGSEREPESASAGGAE
jgi:DNA-binding CsgD family transcriptional regulator